MSIALISGGMGGIGKAVARKLATNGNKIILLLHKDSPEILDFLSTLNGKGHSHFMCDVSDDIKTESVVAQIIKENGNIDILVHCAIDPIVRKSTLDMSTFQFRGQFEAGLFGGFNLFSQVGKHMRENKKGVIIGITTTAILPDANPGNMAGYISAKFALRGLLRELARTLSPYNVRVNAVAPSFVQTKLNSDLPERIIDFVKEQNPNGKIVTPEDVAEVISLICSPNGESINGLMLPVIFGETVKL